MHALATYSREAPLPIGSFQVSYTRNREFYHVTQADPDKMDILREIFHRILTPLYGPQDKAIKQIEESKDRSCFLLCEDGVAVGVLVFKTILSDEFGEYGISKSVEVKSLFVDHAANNSGKGLGSALLDKLKEEVARLNLGQENIHVTVSETKEESLQFFKKKGFHIAHQWNGRYISGVTEYLLVCPFNKDIRAVSQSVAEHFQRNYSDPGAAELVDIIHNVHTDDIHTLTKLSDGTFISGSKDNCLYKWTHEGVCLQIVDEVEPTQQNERNWITTAVVLNDHYWLSGQRNGKLSLWKTTGEYVKDFFLKLPRLHDHISHVYNARRINCLAKGLDPSRPSFFVGFPTMFDEFNLIEGRTESSTKVHQNDWVYCIHPLTDRRILTVIGGSVGLWAKTDNLQWSHLENLVPEEPRAGVYSRKGSSPLSPSSGRVFISSLTYLQSSSQLFALTLFDGSIKILDLESKNIIWRKKEHEDKVRVLENVRDHVFTSGGKDKTIKLWDTRKQESVRTVDKGIEAMAMLRLDEHRLVVGTSLLPYGGSDFRFYDFRR